MELKRNLSFRMLIFLTINALIGTGIFFAPGIAAAIAGVNSIWSWLLAITISILIALVFAELASIFPKAGGVYEYAKQAYGKFGGFLTGWIGWVVANVVIAMLVIGGLDYLGVVIPMSQFVKLSIAVGFILLVNFISFKGIELSSKLLLAFSMITIAVLVIIAIAGSASFDSNNLKDITIPATTAAIPIFIAMFYALETFFGWESIAFLSEEAKNPKKNIPKAILIGTVIVSIFVLLIVFISLAAVPANELGASKYPLLLVASKIFPANFIKFISILAVLNILGGAASWIITTPRLVFAMSRDKVLPESFSRIHKKYQTPYTAIILQTVITILVILSGSYKFLLNVALPLAIILYAAVILSIPKLRRDYPNLKRTFKVPFPIFICLGITALLFGAMAISTTLQNLLLGFVLVALGIPLYIIAALGYHEKIIKYFSNWFAEISYMSNKASYSNIINHITNYLSDVTVERVLDLGCGVGVVTNKIAEEVIPQSGKVYGIDFSERALGIAKKISESRDIKNIEFIHENFYKLTKNKVVNKKISNLDAVVGVGVLGYIDRLEVVLKEIRKRLRKGGKIYFIDYDYPGHLLDKPLIEDSKAIYNLFSKYGLNIKVWRQKSLFWTYVHIYGTKT